MRRISSQLTFFYKRVFPFVWFGFLAVFIATALVSHPNSSSAPLLPFLLIPAVMIVFGFFLMKKLVFDLVDEVWDAGDSLVVRNRGEEQRIALSDVKNVNYQSFSSPPRVTLSLRQPLTSGDRITFCAPVRLIPLSTSPIIDDLINRIDAARRAQA
jgi:hypothetical protein